MQLTTTPNVWQSKPHLQKQKLEPPSTGAWKLKPQTSEKQSEPSKGAWPKPQPVKLQHQEQPVPATSAWPKSHAVQVQHEGLLPPTRVPKQNQQKQEPAAGALPPKSQALQSQRQQQSLLPTGAWQPKLQAVQDQDIYKAKKSGNLQQSVYQQQSHEITQPLKQPDEQVS